MDDTYTFDDGSTLFSDGQGGYGATESPYNYAMLDQVEQQRLGGFQSRGSGQAWWENALSNGFVKAVDSVFQSRELQRIGAAKPAGVGNPYGYTLFPGVSNGRLLGPGSNGVGTLLLIAGLAYFLLK